MLHFDGQRVLILAPHADDETLGCGGVIQKYIAHQSPVRVVVASFVLGEYRKFYKELGTYVPYSGHMRYKEMELAFQTLGVSNYHVLHLEKASVSYHGMLDAHPQIELVTALEDEIRSFQPTVVYIPSRTKHQDHTALHEAAVTATRPYFWHGSVLVYETDGELEFQPNVYVPITPVEMKCKRTALKAYQSQVMKDIQHPVSLHAMTVKAEFRGQQVYATYAEAFQALRIHGGDL